MCTCEYIIIGHAEKGEEKENIGDLMRNDAHSEADVTRSDVQAEDPVSVP